MYYIYILTNAHRNVFYTGVTNDLSRRIREHQIGKYDGFTKKYNVSTLVYFEVCDNFAKATHRERMVKKWKREIKFDAINKMNPEWIDLSPTLTNAFHDYEESE